MLIKLSRTELQLGKVIRSAFIKSIPILCSYLFVSMAYGMMMENAGYHWYYLLMISKVLYQKENREKLP